MKTKLFLIKLFPSFLILTLLLTTSAGLLVLEKKSPEEKDFKIIVERTNNEIKLKCEEGCAWKDLTYSIKNYKPQAIDEFGMTELNKNSSVKDANLTDFLFTIVKTEKRIKLKGVEGTAWTDLSFSLPKNGKRVINQFGVKKLN